MKIRTNYTFNSISFFTLLCLLRIFCGCRWSQFL